MVTPTFDPGIYTNIFQVTLPSDPVTLKILPDSGSEFRGLRQLRDSLSGCLVWVYADQGFIYGYGPDATNLEKRGFTNKTIFLAQQPRLAMRLVQEGVQDRLEKAGGEVDIRKGHLTALHPIQYSQVANGNVRVYRGYEIGTRFWKDLASDKIVFGLVVDIRWFLRDRHGKPVGLQEIRVKHGETAVREIGQIQQELLPSSSRTNKEVARQRFIEQIVPFAQKHSSFELRCGGRVTLRPKPIRIVIGGDV